MGTLSEKLVMETRNENINQRSIVFGMGMSGLSVARFLRARGHQFVLADTRDLPPNREALVADFPQQKHYFGNTDSIDINDYDELIVSPGLALSEPLVQAAKSAGLKITGDIELFYQHAQAPIIAVTGSNGKSSVVTLITEILTADGYRVYCGGNIGVPALELLQREQPDYYVLEVSSFQLETTRDFAPEIAVILNISPDHLDRYASMEDYVAAKLKIFAKAANCIVPRNGEFLDYVNAASETIRFGTSGSNDDSYILRAEHNQQFLVTKEQRKIPVEDICLRGGHNLDNALAALAVTDLVGVSVAAQTRALGKFRGLEHRTELVGEWDSVRWINDSKGTNVGATIAALNGCIKDSRGILIAGGVGKGADFSALKHPVETKTKAVVLFGQDAEAIAAALGSNAAVYLVQDLSAAVEKAKSISSPGDTILFSPACASFDMFSNYQQRGNAFKNAVLASCSK